MPRGVYPRTKEHGLNISRANTGKRPWNTGLTSKTDSRVAAQAKAIGETYKNDLTYGTRVSEGNKKAYQDNPKRSETRTIGNMLFHNRFQGTREEAIIFTNLKRQYPLHLKHFDKMHDRCSGGYATISSEFSWTAEGFQNFINEVGPYPYGIVRPSIGRYHHDEGYVRGNFGWQELSENCAEGHSVRGVRSWKK